MNSNTSAGGYPIAFYSEALPNRHAIYGYLEVGCTCFLFALKVFYPRNGSDRNDNYSYETRGVARSGGVHGRGEKGAPCSGK